MFAPSFVRRGSRAGRLRPPERHRLCVVRPGNLRGQMFVSRNSSLCQAYNQRTLNFEFPMWNCYSWPMQTADQLRELFRMQKALNERIGVQTEGMSEADKTKWVLNYARAMTQEIAA